MYEATHGHIASRLGQGRRLASICPACRSLGTRKNTSATAVPNGQFCASRHVSTVEIDATRIGGYLRPGRHGDLDGR